MSLNVSLSYTPTGSAVSFLLATIHDPLLLTAAIERAIEQTAAQAASESNPATLIALRAQLRCLRDCLEEISPASARAAYAGVM